jgi:phosphoglycerol transferase MdoB-like AlkP superfamily enzyme
MPPAFASLVRLPVIALGDRRRAGWGVLLALHLVAAGILLWSEGGPIAQLGFVLAWGLWNFIFLLILRRPIVAAAISLLLLIVLVLLSQLKFHALFQTVSFVDVMIIDLNTTRFLFAIYPTLTQTVAVIAPVVALLLFALWWLDTFRLPRRIALTGGALCLAGLGALGYWQPLEPSEAFYGGNYLSSFARSGVDAVAEFATRGYMESDPTASDRLKAMDEETCKPAGKPPHIIMVHDESSFDIRMLAGIKVPDGYGTHFQSYDGKERRLLVEGSGGPSWYTEFNVLAGLSSRSFGRFAYFVTRIAAGRVKRGLPNSLRHCGYRTYSIYPWLGAFMGARSFQASVGVQRFRDIRDLGTRDLEPDSFFYNQTSQIVARERGKGPLFIFTYLAANHFPWTFRYRPDLLPNWRDLGNAPNVDEYLRRQVMSFGDYANFVASLKRDFPGERFLIVRFGDHQPDFAANFVDPSLSEAEIAQRLINFDPRYFTTYYAIDAVNFRPADLSSALEVLDASYLPLVVQEAAALPLDPSFGEQKKIFQRCKGLFYACSGGAEARRFNRLLIEAGLIKGL